MLQPSKNRCFYLFFRLPSDRCRFLTAKTADSALENKNILRLDEKLDSRHVGPNGRPTTARVPRPLSKTRGRDQAVISREAPTPQDQGGSPSPWDQQRPKSLISTGRAVEMLLPSKTRRFWPPKPAFFGGIFPALLGSALRRETLNPKP